MVEPHSPPALANLPLVGGTHLETGSCRGCTARLGSHVDTLKVGFAQKPGQVSHHRALSIGLADQPRRLHFLSYAHWWLGHTALRWRRWNVLDSIST